MPEDPGRVEYSTGEGLSKSEILRGHDKFRKVMSESVVFSGKYLKLLLHIEYPDKEYKPQSPPDTSRVRVGFLITKKKIRKAALRNRIRRVIKELYRKQKFHFRNIQSDASMIITLTTEGYVLFEKYPSLKSYSLSDDMSNALTKASIYIKSK